MTSTLSGKTALVTGSSRGIGRATALGLAREGALAAVHYGRDKQAAQQTVDLIEKGGGRAFAVGAELGTPGAVDVLTEAVDHVTVGPIARCFCRGEETVAAVDRVG